MDVQSIGAASRFRPFLTTGGQGTGGMGLPGRNDASTTSHRFRGLVERDRNSRIQFSEEFVGDAAAFFRACAAHELEGIVSKLATSRYRSGRLWHRPRT